MQLWEPPMLAQAARSIEDWNNGRVEELFKHYREDAVLCAPSAPTGRKWHQGIDDIRGYFKRFRDLRPRLKIVDLHLGSQFFTVILSDETGFVTFQVEPDADAAVRRIIVSQSILKILPAYPAG